jgi:hypothetical protein
LALSGSPPAGGRGVVRSLRQPSRGDQQRGREQPTIDVRRSIGPARFQYVAMRQDALESAPHP